MNVHSEIILRYSSDTKPPPVRGRSLSHAFVVHASSIRAHIRDVHQPTSRRKDKNTLHTGSRRTPVPSPRFESATAAKSHDNGRRRSPFLGRRACCRASGPPPARVKRVPRGADTRRLKMKKNSIVIEQ